MIILILSTVHLCVIVGVVIIEERKQILITRAAEKER